MVIFLLAFYLICDVSATINVLDKGIIQLERNSVGIQFFIDVENEDRTQNCRVLCWAKRCCLNDTDNLDCSVMKVYGGGMYTVEPKDRETVINVYPTIVQHDLVGYCDFVLDSKCGRSIRRRRQYVYIPFDTRVSRNWMKPNLLKSYIGERKRSDCDSLDEDSLNDCKPVNCDHKYSGTRSFYENRQKKCIPAALCISSQKELPDWVFVPNSNICRDLEHPLSVKDVYDINTGTYVTTKSPIIEYEMHSNCSTISQNLMLLKDIMFGKLRLNDDPSKVDYSQCVKLAVLRTLGWIALSTVLIMFCVLVMWMCTNDDRRYSESGYTISAYWQSLRGCWRKKKQEEPSYISIPLKSSRINAKVRNELLRDVMVRDLPLELRASMANICDRMDTEVKWKKRYRRQDLGSQISLKKESSGTSRTSSSTEDDDCSEKDRLLK